MEQSLRIVPAAESKKAAIQDTANSLGLHDTLEYGPRSLATHVKTDHPLRHRLESWEETQDMLKLTMQRKAFGIHAPVALLMERKMVAVNPHMPALPQSNIHLDILMGRDECIEPVDIFGDPESGPPLDIHRDMERKLRI